MLNLIILLETMIPCDWGLFLLLSMFWSLVLKIIYLKWFEVIFFLSEKLPRKLLWFVLKPALLVIELLTSQQAKLTHHHTGSSSFSFVCNSHLILRWVTLSWSSNSHSDLTSISFPFFLMNDTPILSSIGFNIYFPLNHTLMLLSVWITSLIIMDSHAICSD